MNKSVGFILLLLMFTNTMNAELANGKIEEFFIKNGIEERKIRIYYPNNNSVDDDTTFIIMNDGEELFLERDSWRGRTWRIDKSFDGLAKINKDPNVIIIAVQSAKKYKGKFFDQLRILGFSDNDSNYLLSNLKIDEINISDFDIKEYDKINNILNAQNF